jgi:hypothetical protein
MPRSIDDLVDPVDHAWPTVLAWLAGGIRPASILPPTPGGPRTLEALQVTTRSPMGSIALESGGILVDDGWLRLLGGSEPERDLGLLTWNGLLPNTAPLVPGALVVAIDVLGGLFVINDLAFDDGRGNVWYFAPDTLEWLDTGLSYSGFVRWSVEGDLDGYYTDLRWPGWRDETAPLSLNEGISIYPFPWASTGGALKDRSRRVVPIDELAPIYLETRRQLGATNSQRPVRVLFEDP